jgi:hypothetical protein
LYEYSYTFENYEEAMVDFVQLA